MTIFKTFLKLVNKNKGQLILYTAILIILTCVTLNSNETNINYIDSKPDIIIVDNDNTKLSKHLTNYFKKNANVATEKYTNDQIEDELFYRFKSYVIYIPKDFENSVLNKNIKEIKYKSASDYEASLANIILNKYLTTLNIYKDYQTIDEITNHVDKALESKTKIELSSTLNTNELSKASFYYSYMNYSLLAGCIYVLVVIISIFREKNILKRNTISSKNYNKLNRQLLLSSFIFGIIIWLIYVGISFIILKDIMLSINCLCIIALSFIFLIYCLSIGFFISNILTSKNAINGIINVISLGTSFICGVFVKLELLPNSVIKIAKFIPNYYYIEGINKLIEIENINLSTLKPILSNIMILLISSLILVVTSFIISKKKRKIA